MGPHWTVYVLNCTNGVGVLKWSGVVCDESVLVTGLGYSYRYRARYGPGQTAGPGPPCERWLLVVAGLDWSLTAHVWW